MVQTLTAETSTLGSSNNIFAKAGRLKQAR